MDMELSGDNLVVRGTSLAPSSSLSQGDEVLLGSLRQLPTWSEIS